MQVSIKFNIRIAKVTSIKSQKPLNSPNPKLDLKQKNYPKTIVNLYSEYSLYFDCKTAGT